MILVDTSVWIDFFNQKKTRAVDLLEISIKNRETLCICGIILTEILQGIKSESQYHQTYRALNILVFLENSKETFISAAKIYRTLQKKGITIRGTIDCVIAATAIEHDVILLHNDKDFTRMQKYTSLKSMDDFIK